MAEKDAPQEKTAPDYEAWVRLGLSIYIVLMVSALIIFDPKLSRHSQMLVKILLAFAMGALTASMVGYLHIEHRTKRAAIRASGGFAVFLIVFFALPAMLPGLVERPQASLTISPWARVDFRTFDDPATEKGASGDSSIAVTLPLSAAAISSVIPAQPAHIENARLDLTIADRSVSMPWAWFVSHQAVRNPGWTWHSATPKKDVSPRIVQVDQDLQTEVMFQTPPGNLKWKQFIAGMAAGKCPSELKVTWDTRQDDRIVSIAQQCALQCEGINRDILDYVERNGRIPARIGIPCA